MPTAKRGRPKASEIPILIREADEEGGTMRCPYLGCRRKFPRNKSLKAHLRTHTGEAPYKCTYPNCFRRFKQSGQLKTHVKRHTLEKPFACSYPGCLTRFTHSSRHCRKHLGYPLKKDNLEVVVIDENHTEEERKWLKDYIENKDKPVKRISTNTALKQLQGVSNASCSSAFTFHNQSSSSGVSSYSDTSRESSLSPRIQFCRDLEQRLERGFQELRQQAQHPQRSLPADAQATDSNILERNRFQELRQQAQPPQRSLPADAQATDSNILERNRFQELRQQAQPPQRSLPADAQATDSNILERNRFQMQEISLEEQPYQRFSHVDKRTMSAALGLCKLSDYWW